MRMSNTNFIIYIVCICILATIVIVSGTAPVGSVPMKVINHAGATVDLYWINTFKPIAPGENQHELVKQTEKPIRNNSDTTINSYDTHKFIVRFVKHIEGVETIFTKGPMEETITIKYNPDTKTMSTIQRSKIDDVMDKVKIASKSCEQFEGEQYADCISNIVIQDISKISDSKDLMVSYRDIMAERLRDYICSDNAVNMTEATKVSDYYDTSKNRHLSVSTLLEAEAGKIWYTENFLDEKDCQIIQAYHATHGNSLYKNNTVIMSQFDLTNRKSPQSAHLRSLHDRLAAFYRHKTAVANMNEEGQEDIYTFQYKQGGESSSQCDHDCSGDFADSGDRVATVLLYCQIPTQGGITVFPKSDIIVKPAQYSALLLSYVGADGRLDEGLVERSECPVVQGEKMQSVIHLRFDVTAENPWHSFTNSNGNSNKDSSSKSKTKFKTTASNNDDVDDNSGDGDQENIEYEDENNNDEL